MNIICITTLAVFVLSNLGMEDLGSSHDAYGLLLRLILLGLHVLHTRIGQDRQDIISITTKTG